MSCCGSKRSQFRQVIQPLTREPARLAVTPIRTTYEYVGRTALTVEGPVSRRRYHFARPGARAEVDVRDAPSMARVPLLVQVR